MSALTTARPTAQPTDVERQSYPYRCGGALVGVENALHHLHQLPETGDWETDWRIAQAVAQLNRANDYLNGVKS